MKYNEMSLIALMYLETLSIGRVLWLIANVYNIRHVKNLAHRIRRIRRCTWHPAGGLTSNGPGSLSSLTYIGHMIVQSKNKYPEILTCN